MSMRRDGRTGAWAPVLATLALAGLLFSGPAPAQDAEIPPAVYPRLPRDAASAEAFVPRGWRLEAQASGDLDADGVRDLALVLRQADPADTVRLPELDEPFDTKPRILAVALRETANGRFVLNVENHRLIPRHVNPSQEDPFEASDLRIERGVLKVGLSLFMTAGGWETARSTYTFGHRDGRFSLIGFDRFTAHRARGDTREVSVNYLTRRMKVTEGHISRDDGKVRWTSLKPRPLLSVDEVGDGLDFDPRP